MGTSGARVVMKASVLATLFCTVTYALHPLMNQAIYYAWRHPGIVGARIVQAGLCGYGMYKRYEMGPLIQWHKEQCGAGSNNYINVLQSNVNKYQSQVVSPLLANRNALEAVVVIELLLRGHREYMRWSKKRENEVDFCV